jgi:hypothetical protein
MNENDLMSRLVASKAIMDNPKFTKSRNSINDGLPPTSLQDFDIPNAKYNIPQEFLQESSSMSQPYLSELPKVNTKPVGVPSVDAIKSSKLPDEIKRLMIEHPISQPQQQAGGATLSDDLIERASRLMKNENSNNYIPESVKPKTQQPQTQSTSASQIDYKLIKKMIREAVDEALEENGLIVESSEKANEMLSFKVGKHVFEGKVTKIKKLV